MVQFRRLLALVTLLIVGLGVWFGDPHAAIAAGFKDMVLATTALRNKADAGLDIVYGDKIDLNNTDVRSFRKYPGMYPTLARILVKHSPYEQVEDILDVRELSQQQKAFLASKLDLFTVSPPIDAFVAGQDRINPGIYR